MILDILIVFSCIAFQVFLFFVLVFSFSTLRKMKSFMAQVKESNQYMEEQIQHMKGYGSETREDLSRLEQKIDELRLQVGIINGRMGQTIQITDFQTKIPYTGAKRGPKPKNQDQE